MHWRLELIPSSYINVGEEFAAVLTCLYIFPWSAISSRSRFIIDHKQFGFSAFGDNFKSLMRRFGADHVGARLFLLLSGRRIADFFVVVFGFFPCAASLVKRKKTYCQSPAHLAVRNKVGPCAFYFSWIHVRQQMNSSQVGQRDYGPVDKTHLDLHLRKRLTFAMLTLTSSQCFSIFS